MVPVQKIAELAMALSRLIEDVIDVIVHCWPNFQTSV